MGRVSLLTAIEVGDHPDLVLQPQRQVTPRTPEYSRLEGAFPNFRTQWRFGIILRNGRSQEVQPMNKSAIVFLGLWLIPTIAVGQAMTDLRGGGSWNADSETKRSEQRWDLDLHRDGGGSISGRINVADSPLMTQGHVQGKFDGYMISGTIVDERGAYVARFNGLLRGSRFQGRYTDRTGETGKWEWEGQLPRIDGVD